MSDEKKDSNVDIVIAIEKKLLAAIDAEPERVSEADITFAEEIPTSPELRVQIKKNIVVSKSVVTRAGTILESLKRNSSRPPKE